MEQPPIKVRYHHRVTQYDPVSDVPPRFLVQARDPLGYDAPSHRRRFERGGCLAAVVGTQRHVGGLHGAVGRHLPEAPEPPELLPVLAVRAQVGGHLLEGDGDALEGRISGQKKRGLDAVLLSI